MYELIKATEAAMLEELHAVCSQLDENPELDIVAELLQGNEESMDYNLFSQLGNICTFLADLVEEDGFVERWTENNPLFPIMVKEYPNVNTVYELRTPAGVIKHDTLSDQCVQESKIGVFNQQIEQALQNLNGAFPDNVSFALLAVETDPQGGLSGIRQITKGKLTRHSLDGWLAIIRMLSMEDVDNGSDLLGDPPSEEDAEPPVDPKLFLKEWEQVERLDIVSMHDEEWAIACDEFTAVGLYQNGELVDIKDVEPRHG